MTWQTRFDDLPGRHFRIRADVSLPAARLDVRLSGPVTTLAARSLRGSAGFNQELVVCVFEEVEPDVRMAGAADVAADVIPRESGRYGAEDQRKERKPRSPP